MQAALSSLSMHETLTEVGDEEASTNIGTRLAEFTEAETDVHEILLPPGRHFLMRLGVRALREGHLTVDGVKWKLNNIARGRHSFEMHGRRLNNTKVERLGKAYAFGQSLAMPVVAAKPLLHARVDGLPQSMLLGECVMATLLLSNVGGTSMCEAKLRLG